MKFLKIKLYESEQIAYLNPHRINAIYPGSSIYIEDQKEVLDTPQIAYGDFERYNVDEDYTMERLERMLAECGVELVT
jgi:hypothetical protein